LVLKGNQGELPAWALEGFKGMEERRLPGETEAAWNLVRDGEVWTCRVWASPYLPDAGLSRVRAGGAGGAGGGAQGDGGGEAHGELRPHRPGAGGGGCEAAWSSTATRSVPCRRLPGAGSGGTGLGGSPGLSGLAAPPPGVREKKAALEAFSFNPLAALRFLGLYAV